jgi:alginate O-acetyltransferase complex protein AlgI
LLFNSPVFLFVFLPVTLAGFLFLVGLNRPALTVPWLLAASMVFYGWWSPFFLLVLVGSTLINWTIADTMARRPQQRRLLLMAGLIWNLGLLGYFKYADFFLTTVDSLWGANFVLVHVILPLGISFFTFQKIAYLVDNYRGQARAGTLLEFSLFVFFFPQLIAGPIVHHAEIMPQLSEMMVGRLSTRRTIWVNLAVGGTLLIMGLAKKVVVADQLAPYSSTVFFLADHDTPIGAVAAWSGVLAFTAQLYFDFSGYSDMAIGLARMFGVRLPANFNSPYQSLSIIEFWRRWHVTLSRFLRDYLYIPLGGNRYGRPRQYANLMIVMLLGGLWHGAGWTYVLWGGVHGMYLLAAHAWQRWSPWRIAPALGWALTLLAVVIAWTLFRSGDLACAENLLTGMAFGHGIVTEGSGLRPIRGIILALLALAFCVSAPNSQTILRSFYPTLGPVSEPSSPWRTRLVWVPSTGMALAASLGLAAITVLSWNSSEFLYFQF